MHRRRLVVLALLLTAALIVTGAMAASVPDTSSASGQPRGAGPGTAHVFPEAIKEQVRRGQANQRRPYAGYSRISDDAQVLRAEVPDAWGEVETGRWTYDGREVGLFVAASDDLGRFTSTWTGSGAFLGVSRDLALAYDVKGLLGAEQRGAARQCAHQGRFGYEDRFYTGEYDFYAGCQRGGHLLTVVAVPADQAYVLVLRLGVTGEADLAAAARLLETFQVLGDPEGGDEHHDD